MENNIFNIRDFGAISDGKKNNTISIQNAIDACHSAGGGIVLVNGGNYITGTIFLKSNITLMVERGSSLLGSTDIKDYEESKYPFLFSRHFILFTRRSFCLICADDAENISITGGGIIDGQANHFINFTDQENLQGVRPYLVLFTKCRNVKIRDAIFKNPGIWNLCFRMSNNVWVDSISIESLGTINGDGIDFVGGENVFISNCNIKAGDDAITLKSIDPEYPCKNFVITNCIISSHWAAVRIGPESAGGMKEITISNCVFYNCRDGLKIQNTSDSEFNNIIISNIAMKDVRRPVFMTLNSYSFGEKEGTCRPNIGCIKNIKISNINSILSDSEKIKDPADYPCFVITGINNHQIENITLSSIYMLFPGGGTEDISKRIDIPELLDFTELWPEVMHFNGPLPSSCIMLRHIKRSVIKDMRLLLINRDERPFIYCNDVNDTEFGGVKAYGLSPKSALFKIVDCNKIQIKNCTAKSKDLILPLKANSNKTENKLYKVFKEKTINFECKLSEMARLIDSADAANTVYIIKNTYWSKELKDGVLTYFSQVLIPEWEEGKRVYIYFECVWGCLEVFVNDEAAGSLEVPKWYRWKYYWAIDITDKVKNGEFNSIKVSAKNFGEIIVYDAPDIRRYDPNINPKDNAILNQVHIKIGDLSGLKPDHY